MKYTYVSYNLLSTCSSSHCHLLCRDPQKRTPQICTKWKKQFHTTPIPCQHVCQSLSEFEMAVSDHVTCMQMYSIHPRILYLNGNNRLTVWIIELNGIPENTIQYEYYYTIRQHSSSSNEGYLRWNGIECYKDRIIAFEGCLNGIRSL